MRTITLMTDNRTGLLSDVSYILGKNRVNIEGLEVDVMGEKAVIDLTVRNTEKATRILEKNGFEVITKKGILVKIANERYGLEQVKERLSEMGIKVETAELICGSEEKGLFSINVNQPRKANRIITKMIALTT